MSKSLIILLAALFSFSVLASAFHHHAELKAYPSCIYCKLAKDVSSTELVILSFTDFPKPLPDSAFPLSLESSQLVYCLTGKSRAPPVWFLQRSYCR